MTDVFKMVHEITVKINKETDELVLGEIQSIAKENGVADEIVLNEKAITQALLKSQKRKVFYDSQMHVYCPNCKGCTIEELAFYRPSYCPSCGQALDWEVG